MEKEKEIRRAREAGKKLILLFRSRKRLIWRTHSEECESQEALLVSNWK
jgi:hypothetical protein